MLPINIAINLVWRLDFHQEPYRSYRVLQDLCNHTTKSTGPRFEICVLYIIAELTREVA